LNSSAQKAATCCLGRFRVASHFTNTMFLLCSLLASVLLLLSHLGLRK
jgi:hypothetical protein